MHRVGDLSGTVHLQPSRLAEHDARGARGTLQEDRLPVNLTLLPFVPVVEATVVHGAVERGLESNRPTEIQGRDAATDNHHIFIRQADEPLKADVHGLPGTALPAEPTGE